MRLLLSAVLGLSACSEASPIAASPSPSVAPTTVGPPNSPGTAVSTDPLLSTLPQPALPPGATVSNRGVQEFTLGAGEHFTFDPPDPMLQETCRAAGCGDWDYGTPSFVWSSAWTATGPLRSTFVDAGVVTVLGTGRSGAALLALTALEFRNDGPTLVSARLVYTIASR